MGRKSLSSVMIYLLFSIIILSTLAFALEESIVKTQGVVMNIDFKKKTMVVNERPGVWNKDTMFYDDKGMPIPADRFKPHSWVFVEWKEQGKNFLIQEIYLLPKYVDRNERHLYPFMQ